MVDIGLCAYAVNQFYALPSKPLNDTVCSGKILVHFFSKCIVTLH